MLLPDGNLRQFSAAFTLCSLSLPTLTIATRTLQIDLEEPVEEKKKKEKKKKVPNNLPE